MIRFAVAKFNLRNAIIVEIILASLLILLPFSILHVNLFSTLIFKLLFYIVGIYSLYLISRRVKYSNRNLIIFLLLILSSVNGLIHVPDLQSFVLNFLPNFLMFFLGFSLILWSKEFNGDLILKVMVAVIIFHSIDIIFQYIFNYNLVGLEPYIESRYWGFFYYGSPSAGIFLSTLFFVPWFVLKGHVRTLSYIVLILALFMAGDRGPILQIFSILFIYGIRFKFKFSMIVFGLFLLSMQFFLESFPPRVIMLSNLVYDIFSGSYSIYDGIESGSDPYSINAYLLKYVTIYDKWLSIDNFWNIIFGAGVGGSEFALAEVSGVGRPHSNWIEFFTIFGVTGSIAALYYLYKLLIKSRELSILLMPSIFPFLFSSVYSFNWFFLFLLTVMVFNFLSHSLGFPVNRDNNCNAKR